MAQNPTLPPFDLAPAGAVPPLDLPALPGMAPSPPPQAAPAAAPQDSRGSQVLSQLGPLLPLLAVAMRTGGRAGMAGFLQGVQQARARKAEQARLGQQDARQAGLDQQNQDYRQQEMMLRAEQQRQAALQRQQQVLDQFRTALGGVDNDDAVRALLELYGPQADAVGVGRPSLEKFAMQTATPTTLQKRRAEKIISDLERQHGNNWISIGGSFTYRVPGEDQPIPFDELLRRAGRTQTAPLPQATDPLAPNTPEEQFYQQFARENGAQSFGALPTAKQAEARKLWMQADDRPLQSGGGGSSVQDQRRFNMEQRLVAQWDRANTPLREMRRQLGLMQTGLQRFRTGDTNGGAQAVLVTFQKILDPTSVVRESEYARTASGQSLINRFDGFVQRLAAGGAGLTDAEMAAMVQTAQEFLAGMDTFNAGLRTRIERTAQEYQLDPRLIFDDAAPAEPPPSPAGGRPRVTPSSGRGAGPAGGVSPGQNPFRRN